MSLSGLIVAIAVLLAGTSSSGRDLRPSEHGLMFQASPPAKSSPEMRSFFSTGQSSSSSDGPLQNATESLPPAWWGVTGGRRSHVGRALITASVVCGITGGVLLVASALLYLFRHRRGAHQNEAFHNESHSNYNTNINNKLQLVPAVSNR